jgi:phosphoserine aminotransferase
MKAMKKRIYNFSAGPAILPEEVLLEAQEDLFSYKDTGMSVMEMSHRSKVYDGIFKAAQNDLKKLYNIGDDYTVLLLQGGATLQFSMVPLNLMPPVNKADYINTGAWSKKAIKEAKRVGSVNVAASSEDKNFSYIPKEFNFDPEAAYVHYTSNNTIFGTQFKSEPEVGDKILVCDASSDILHKPLDINKYGILYAGAQKNIGPAGVSVVIIRNDLLEKSPEELHAYMSYKVHAGAGSMYNTPNTYGSYICGLVFKYLLNNGGLEAMYKKNVEKAGMLYSFIDETDGYYKPAAAKEDRSLMNVTFNMATEDLEKKFIAEAGEKGFSGLKGHRSVGGMRASIYNAFPTQGVADLVQFMKDFKANN